MNFTKLLLCFKTLAYMRRGFSLVTRPKALQNLVCSSSQASCRKFLDAGAQGPVLVPTVLLKLCNGFRALLCALLREVLHLPCNALS